MATALVAVAAAASAKPAPRAEGRRLVGEKTGTLATRPGLRLRLVADVGHVHILTQETDQVSYKIRLETDSREADTQSLLKQFVLNSRATPAGVQLTSQAGGHVWVSFEVTVPRRYNVDVLTQAGNIETQPLDGRAVLVTAGGSISAGQLGGSEAAGARLETQGGHITVQEVNGELRATTAGGHINATHVRGDAVLRTGGGHIRVGTIEGTAQLDTGGGSITVQHAGGSVTASTGGGHIDLGETSGPVRARTGGGGIHVLRVAGPTQLETGGGSIFLAKVQGAVRASTGAGSITAWFASGAPAGTPLQGPAPAVRKLLGASQLESGHGDIVVYLPRELAITIEAIIEAAADHRIEADPNLPLKLTYPDSRAGGTVHGQCALNGGGEVLKLKTVGGNIRLKFSDTGLHEDQMKELKRRLEFQQQRLMEWQRRQERQPQASDRRQEEPAAAQVRQKSAEPDPGPFEGLERRIEERWLGGVRVNPETQQQKLIQSALPVYPDVARQAGIEGAVRLRVSVGRDGTVQEVRALSGEAVLAHAAAEAVRKWRYQPTLVEGRPVSVVTTVTVEFRLK